MNTLISDLTNLIHNHLDIIQSCFIELDVQNNYLEYKTDPKWLLYLLRKKDKRVLDFLIDSKNVDWLVHLAKYTNSKKIIEKICQLLIRDANFTLASSYWTNMTPGDKRLMIIEAIIKSIEVGDFVCFKTLIENEFDMLEAEVISAIYKHGHKDIVEYYEKNTKTYLENTMPHKILGMLSCQKNLYDRNILITLVKHEIRDSRALWLEHWTVECGSWAPDGQFLEAIFTPEQLDSNCLKLLNGAVCNNNNAIIDYIIDRFYIMDDKYHSRRAEMVQLLVHCNATKQLNKLILKDSNNFNQYGVFRYIDNISIKTIKLILPFTPHNYQSLIKKCPNERYDLICYLCSLERTL